MSKKRLITRKQLQLKFPISGNKNNNSCFLWSFLVYKVFSYLHIYSYIFSHVSVIYSLIPSIKVLTEGSFVTIGKAQGIREAVTDYFKLKHGSWLFAQKSLEVLSTLSVCGTKWVVLKIFTWKLFFCPVIYLELSPKGNLEMLISVSLRCKEDLQKSSSDV